MPASSVNHWPPPSPACAQRGEHLPANGGRNATRPSAPDASGPLPATPPRAEPLPLTARGRGSSPIASEADRGCRGMSEIRRSIPQPQESAFALIASNSCWVIVPASSSSLALAISRGRASRGVAHVLVERLLLGLGLLRRCARASRRAGRSDRRARRGTASRSRTRPTPPCPSRRCRGGGTCR